MRDLLSGNYAIAEAVRLARVPFIAAYPITPQTPVYERLSEMDGQGKLAGVMMRTESEHSAMAACISASLTGVRVFTASSSQGLALMHEMLHFAAGSRAPVVMACVNRALAAPWAFGSDQTDTLSQRDTGWMQFYCEDGQEALDTIIQAYRISEEVLIPSMVVIDGFFTSHFLEPVEIPEQALVDEFIPEGKVPRRFDIEHPGYLGNVVGPQHYFQYREKFFGDAEAAKPVIRRVDEEYGQRTGRRYGMTEAVDTAGAEIVLVTSGAMTSLARVAVRALQDKGVRAGLLKIKTFRPFPAEEIRQHLRGVPKVAVIDRNISIGKGGIFCQELKSALYGLDGGRDGGGNGGRNGQPKIYGYIAGLAAAHVGPEMIEQMATEALQKDTPDSTPRWISGEPS